MVMAAAPRVSSESSSARPGPIQRRSSVLATAAMLGVASLIPLLEPAGVARGDVIFGSSTAVGGGQSGFSGFQTSAPVGLSTLTPTTSLISISDTWTALDTSSVTWRNSMAGGLDPASTPANATVSGRVTVQDDAGGPPPSGTVILSWNESYFDLVLDTPSLINATATYNSPTSATGNELSYGSGVFTTGWTRITANFPRTTGATDSMSWQTTLNPGTYRFATFLGIRDNPNWQATSATMDYSFTVTAVPEPSTAALAAVGIAGAGFAFRRRQLARRTSQAAAS